MSTVRESLDFYTADRDLRETVKTGRERVRALLERYVQRYPSLPTNYTLIVLLYWRDFDGLEIPDSWIHRAAAFETSDVRGITNPWSIGRYFALEKRDFMTVRESVVADELEQAWRFLLAGGTTFDREWEKELK